MKEKDLEYWKNNCEEEYRNTPICVLRYITELEKSVEFAHQQKPQAQYSTSQQIQELIVIANKEGLYDAADFLRNANQQPEVDHECKYCGAMTTEPDEYCYRNPNSKEKQPEQEEIDAMTFIQEECRKEYGRGFITVDTISTYFAAQILERWSTLTQNKDE